MSRKILIIVPGFLTEPHFLARNDQGSVINHLDPSSVLDRRAWSISIKQICHEDVEIINFHWASQSVIDLLCSTLGPLLIKSRHLSFDFLKSQLLQSAREIHDAWTTACHECDAQIPNLHSLIGDYSKLGDVYVLGHSLGARLALKTLNKQKDHTEPFNYRLCVWAPAISQGDLNWSFLEQTKFIPEVMYSQADLVLKLIYPLGHASRPRGHLLDIFSLAGSLMNRVQGQKALGLIGPPSSSPQIKQLSLDLSPQNIRHLTYLSAAEYLFKSSHYLNHLLAHS